MIVILSFVGSLSAAVLFNVKSNKLAWAGLSGMIGWLVYLLVHNATGENTFAIFAGAVAVGVYSECMARVLKAPANVFSISGIFPLVPGIAAYEMIQKAFEDDLLTSFDKALETLMGGAAIALGIMFATSLFRFINRMRSGS